MEFFSCFACDSKQQAIITPVKHQQRIVTIKSKKQLLIQQDYASQQQKTKTVTTLTFQRTQEVKQQQQQRIIKIKNKQIKKFKLSEQLPPYLQSIYFPDINRKAKQSQFIKQNMNPKQELLYIVEKKWSQQYTFYLQDNQKENMRQINNKVLLDSGKLASGLQQKIDYFLVSRKVWIFISKFYGGGPQLKKDVYLPVLFLPVSGIKNNLYYCYLNTGIQCLLSIPQFTFYFRNKSYKQIQYQTKISKRYLCQSTRRIIKLFQQKPGQTHDLEDFSSLFQQKFDKRLQHDCQEFIRYYLQMLQDQLNPIKSHKAPLINKNSEDAYLNYKSMHSSIVDLLFAGQLSNIIKCMNCQNISIKYDPFLDLTIQIGKNTLQGNLAKYFSQEKLNDLYQCERCHVKSKATKQAYISKSPSYLLITFKRFLGIKKKCGENISYPLSLNIQRFCKGNQCGLMQYNLQSIIIHRGTMDKGHYYCLTRRKNTWHYINDEICKKIKIEDNLDLEAYILIYQRVKN